MFVKKKKTVVQSLPVLLCFATINWSCISYFNGKTAILFNVIRLPDTLADSSWSIVYKVTVTPNTYLESSPTGFLYELAEVTRRKGESKTFEWQTNLN